MYTLFLEVNQTRDFVYLIMLFLYILSKHWVHSDQSALIEDHVYVCLFSKTLRKHKNTEPTTQIDLVVFSPLLVLSNLFLSPTHTQSLELAITCCLWKWLLEQKSQQVQAKAAPRHRSVYVCRATLCFPQKKKHLVLTQNARGFVHSCEPNKLKYRFFFRLNYRYDV